MNIYQDYIQEIKKEKTKVFTQNQLTAPNYLAQSSLRSKT